MKPARSIKSLIVNNIEPDSPAAEIGIRPNDRIMRINDHMIRDVIDLQFYGSDPDLNILADREGQLIQFQVENPDLLPLGIDPEPMTCSHCGNQCQFCFIDQNPGGLRDSLYVKDEDYRLSFLHGNYITLTQVNSEDLFRIVEQRLSPLYISIHAVDPVIRKSLLGLKKEDHLLEKLNFLKEHDIEIHGQIVLCPGINDGKTLSETIETLAAYFPQLVSLAVVPVGLTRHRLSLPAIPPVSESIAKTIIRQIRPYQRAYLKKWNHPFVYLADEFYLIADEELPAADHYGDYWQIENGIGMTRYFLEEFHTISRDFPKALKQPEKAVLVTGTLAAPILRDHVLPVLSHIRGLDMILQPVENDFFGSTVTVSGLLTGQDIRHSLIKLKGINRVLLPDNCINQDVFLDNMTLKDLHHAIQTPVQVISGFDGLWL